MFSSRRGRMHVALWLMWLGAAMCLAALLVTVMNGRPVQEMVVPGGGACLAAMAGIMWRREIQRRNVTKVTPALGAGAVGLAASSLVQQLEMRGAGSWAGPALFAVCLGVGLLTIVLVVADIRDDPERRPGH